MRTKIYFLILCSLCILNSYAADTFRVDCITSSSISGVSDTTIIINGNTIKITSVSFQHSLEPSKWYTVKLGDKGAFKIDYSKLNISPFFEGETYVTLTNDRGQYLSVSDPVFLASHTCAEAIPVTGVTLTKTSIYIQPGEKGALYEKIAPENAVNKKVKWTSSKETVATVTSEGFITALSVGEATITVTSMDGNFTSSCKITVQNNLVDINCISASSITGTAEPGAKFFVSCIKSGIEYFGGFNVKADGTFDFSYISFGIPSGLTDYNITFYKAGDGRNFTSNDIKNLSCGQTSIASVNSSPISVYPNPTSDILNVAGEVEKIQVYSMTGQLVSQVENSNQVNVSKLSNGNYIIRMFSGNSVSSQKFIKK